MSTVWSAMSMMMINYGDGEAPGPAAGERRFQLREEEIDLLTRRDIDICHGWPPHVGRYLSR